MLSTAAPGPVRGKAAGDAVPARPEARGSLPSQKANWARRQTMTTANQHAWRFMRSASRQATPLLAESRRTTAAGSTALRIPPSIMDIDTSRAIDTVYRILDPTTRTIPIEKADVHRRRHNAPAGTSYYMEMSMWAAGAPEDPGRPNADVCCGLRPSCHVTQHGAHAARRAHSTGHCHWRPRARRLPRTRPCDVPASRPAGRSRRPSAAHCSPHQARYSSVGLS